MDPFELLKKDHKTVSELFERIEAAKGKAKLGFFQQIKDELELHTHIEEVIFYPALERANETRDLTLEAYEEHKVVKDLLGELDSANAVTDEWRAKLTVLKENVEHHVDEEENELFGKANDVLTGDEAEALGDRMQTEKVKRGGDLPQPDAPTEEPGLLRKIANVLGVGSPSPKPSQPSTMNTRSKKKAEKKSGKVSTKSAGSKSSQSSKASSSAKGPRAGKRKPATAKWPSSSARTGAAAKKKGRAANTGARKRPVAKK
jgi:iron-sulfur cluster repair protein YtfE (RIC family)